MELGSRSPGDVFVPAGSYRRLEASVRQRAVQRARPSLVVYAFDPRTRILPYAYSTTRLAPAGARAVAAAVHEAGLRPVRLVQQQWTPNFDVRRARLDGQPIELLLISAMQIHAAPAIELIQQAWQMGADRPLILVGGPKAIYEPYAFFSLGRQRDIEADAVVTGEEYVLLELLERMLEHTGSDEPLRAGFDRARSAGALEDVLGLVYRRPESPPTCPRLVCTGTRRLVRDLDELPHALVGFGLLEPPHRGRQLASRPLEIARVRRHSPWASLVVTQGCKFRCSYCPIPGYHQHTFRAKSPERLADEITRLHTELGLVHFFGTDDNFFNDRATIEAYFHRLSQVQVGGRPLGQRIQFSTEATEHDVYVNRDLLPLARQVGLTGLYMGLEDLSAELVRKGQSPQRTQELFPLMTSLGITPMVMMMHYDSQPLREQRQGQPVGLLDQVDFVRRLGAVGYQCTVLAPAAGSKMIAHSIENREIFLSVAGQAVPDYCYDGNHVVMGPTDHPWHTQKNLFRAYRRFYSLRNLLRALWRRDPCGGWAVRLQLMGLYYLPGTWREYRRWIRRLRAGRIKPWPGIPTPPFELEVLDTSAPIGGMVELLLRAQQPAQDGRA